MASISAPPEQATADIWPTGRKTPRPATEHVPLDVMDAQSLAVDAQSDQLIALDDALNKLALFDPRLAEVVELRFFAGMEVDALAALLDVSVPTIVRDTRAARAWLRVAMEASPASP